MKFPDRILVAAVFVLSALVFLPLSIWLVEYTLTHDQLLHAFLVLAFTGVLLVLHRGLSLKPEWHFGLLSQNVLIAGYALLLVAWWSQDIYAFLIAYCLAISSVLIFVFGEQRARLIAAVMSAFGVFVGLAIFLPVFDWPLRSLAGQIAAVSLPWIGLETELGLWRGEREPMLILIADGKPFHVAAECNGFGLFSSSILMTLILMIYREGLLVRKLVWIPVAAFMGLFFNYLRIVVIILLAPVVGSENYMLMHEVVGTLFTYGCLGLLWWILIKVPLYGRNAKGLGSKVQKVGHPGE